jgi:hypothetical protein
MNPQPSPTPEPNDPLDALLRETDDYIPDDGFTHRVTTQLPAPRRRVPVRWILVPLAWLLGCALALWLTPTLSADLVALFSNWTEWNWSTLYAAIPVLAMLGSLGWGLWPLVQDEN